MFGFAKQVDGCYVGGVVAAAMAHYRFEALQPGHIRTYPAIPSTGCSGVGAETVIHVTLTCIATDTAAT